MEREAEGRGRDEHGVRAQTAERQSGGAVPEELVERKPTSSNVVE